MLFFVLDELAGTTAGTATAATSQHYYYWHGTAHCQPENPQTELTYHMPSHAVVRRAVRSSQLPDPSPFPTIASYIIGQLAKLVDLDFFSFFLQGTADPIEDIRTHPNTRLATRNLIMTRGVDDDSEQRTISSCPALDSPRRLSTMYDSSLMRVCTCRVYSMYVMLCISPP